MKQMMATFGYAVVTLLPVFSAGFSAWGLKDVHLNLKRTEQMSQEMRHGGVMMGADDHCDNGKNHLAVDWDLKDRSLYSCMPEFVPPSPQEHESKPYAYCSEREDLPLHKCMNETIVYNERIPLSGPHRPVWPVYGEYLYLPPQRWLHSLEHGAVVMLYHPCADKDAVNELKHIVQNCLRRHIITPYNKLIDEPFALVAYRCRLTMNVIDRKEVVKFIKEHALKAPEEVWEDGDYSYGLLKKSETVPLSDEFDKCICPMDDIEDCYEKN